MTVTIRDPNRWISNLNYYENTSLLQRNVQKVEDFKNSPNFEKIEKFSIRQDYK